jgi:hypothetical protein
MSSSSGPYKSRLFNFLNRGAIAFNDNLGKTVRNLKVAVTWGAQILLYPFYLFIQTGRWVERQIENKFTEIKYYLPSDNNTPENEIITTDKLVLSILNEVRVSVNSNLDNSVINQEINLENDHQKIRAIACLLKTKNLVLVNNNNEIIDIFSSEQQQKITKLITWQLSQYWLYKRHQIKKITSSLPLISTNNNHIIAPIKWFWQVFAWMQVSDVARGINLFSESNLNIGYSENSLNINNPLKSYLNNQEIVNKIDKKIFNLEGELIDGKSLISNQQEDILLEDNPFQIQTLIWAAIDHFFGNKNNQKKNLQKESQLPQLTASKFQINEQESDPWLTWEDLSSKTNNEEILAENMGMEQKPIQLLTGNTSSPVTSLRKISQLITQSHQLSETVKAQKASSTSTAKRKNNNLVLTNFNTDKDMELVSQKELNYDQFNNIESKPEWLETEVKHIGYVKNPLEIVLQWLDKFMLWLEEVVIFIINMIKVIIKSINRLLRR